LVRDGIYACVTKMTGSRLNILTSKILQMLVVRDRLQADPRGRFSILTGHTQVPSSPSMSKMNNRLTLNEEVVDRFFLLHHITE